MAGNIRENRYRVEGMDCASCASKIDTAVRRMPGVEDVSVSVAAGTMSVKHADDGELAANIVSKVGKLGYRLHPIAGHQKPAIVAAHTRATILATATATATTTTTTTTTTSISMTMGTMAASTPKPSITRMIIAAATTLPSRSDRSRQIHMRTITAQRMGPGGDRARAD